MSGVQDQPILKIPLKGENYVVKVRRQESRISQNVKILEQNDPSKSIHTWFSVTVSCGGETLYPNCTYCPNSNKGFDNHGCDGNCIFDLEKGECKPKGK